MLRRKLLMGGLALALLLSACAARPAGLLRPNGVALAPDGSLYVMDSGNHRIVHLSPDGKMLGAFGKSGRGDDDIFSGWDLALDAAGSLYICHFLNDENDVTIHDGVKVFSPAGRLLRELGGQDYAFTDSTYSPYGVDIDDQGRIYVADYRSNTVRVFSQAGEQIARFFGVTGSEAGQFNGANDVAVDDARHLLYVTDQINSRVQQFSLTVNISGQLTVTHLLSVGAYGREPGQFSYLQNIAVDDDTGRVYVGDMGNFRIQVFDAQGEFVAEMAPPVPIWQVMGLNVAADGAVYAADARNNAIWVFEPDGRLRARIEVQP